MSSGKIEIRCTCSFDNILNGFEKKTQDHYELHMNYQIPEAEMPVLVKIFNESAYMRYLEPMEGAVEYVKKLAEEIIRSRVAAERNYDLQAVLEDTIQRTMDPRSAARKLLQNWQFGLE